MSMFDKYTITEAVQAMRRFLAIPKKDFLRAAGLVTVPAAGRQGRFSGYDENAVKLLEDRVNAKACRAEGVDTTIAVRYQIARDYQGYKDAEVARRMGVSRELARQWATGIQRPTKVIQLANVLGVPAAWLEFGGEENLTANSYLGVRVGDDALLWREQLYSRELPLLAEVPDNTTVEYAQAYIENAIFIRPDLAQMARRAGGRWQLVGGEFVFAPWAPIRAHGLSMRFWTDAVEAMIQDELADKPSVYAAWHALKARCEAMGLNENQYPKLITLHKRVASQAARVHRFGIDLNTTIEKSCATYLELISPITRQAQRVERAATCHTMAPAAAEI